MYGLEERQWAYPVATLTERRSGTPQTLRRSFRPRFPRLERNSELEGGGVAWFDPSRPAAFRLSPEVVTDASPAHDAA